MTPAPTGPLRDAQRRRASASYCLFRVQKKMAAGARCDDEMTLLRFDDGGCAAMTKAGPLRRSFFIEAAERRSHQAQRGHGAQRRHGPGGTR